METPIRVLLIEDNPADARLIGLLLDEARALQFKLDWVCDLDAGVTHLHTFPVDVVLLDLGLPGSTGLETLQQLQARTAARAPTLVVLSGLTDEDVAVQAVQAGAEDYLVKGQVDSALLVRAIRYAIGRSQADEALRLAHAEAQAAQRRAEDASRAKSTFLANMSHDLRTPLNGILGFAQILQWDRSLSERQQGAVSAIRQCGDHLLALINDVLDVAKIEAGKVEILAGEFDLRRFLCVIEEVIQLKAQSKPMLEFTCELAPDLPASVSADERRLRQVLLNLLDNAVKFTDRGRVILRVQFVPPGRLRFEVQDTGEAIGEDQLARLFKPFEQAGDAQRRSGGTGLGLVISQRFVRLMGGDVEVRCQRGEGNLFAFEIDAPVVAPMGLTDRVSAPYGEPHTRYDGKRQRVLVVDDAPENRAVLVAALERAGCDVQEASNGHDALAAAKTQPVDLILLDIVLPDIGGIEVIRRLRATPHASHTPIIAISASVEPMTQANAVAAGADQFLAKPVNLDALMRGMDRLLNRSAAVR